ncbi:MAG: hypothetical protein K940chlam8_01330, partial [Chlamydiae bacterium]|nr:hypothetical protein [Chlamydiota bacterium]
TPVYTAARNGHAACLEKLIKAKADFNAPVASGVAEGFTPVFIAASNGHAACLKVLIEAKVDFNAPLTEGTCQGFTPVFKAAASGHVECLKVLIEAKVDFNAPITEGMCQGFTPVFKAAASGHVECLKVLIEAGACIHTSIVSGVNWGLNPLCAAIATKKAECITALIEAKASVSSHIPCGPNHGLTPLHFATTKGFSESLALLINIGNVEVNNIVSMGSDGSRETLLYTASKSNHPKCIEVLVKAGADINAVNGGFGDSRGSYPLYLAANCGFIESVRTLIQLGATLDVPLAIGSNKGGTPLYTAAWSNHLECLLALIAAGADTNAQVSVDKSLFEFFRLDATKKEVVDILLAPMHYAIERDMVKSFKELAAAKKEINRSNPMPGDRYGLKPLHLAAYLRRSKDYIDTLVCNGACANDVVDDGRYKGKTPLSIAVMRRNFVATYALLTHLSKNNNKVLNEEDVNSSTSRGIIDFLSDLKTRGKDALNYVEKGKEDTCVICVGLFNNDSQLASLVCGHEMCKGCFDSIKRLEAHFNEEYDSDEDPYDYEMLYT